ncbi:MAG TPA: hypothetical protein VK392_10080 [Thermoanaerobaculia bacterium]|nr:hypothetical protein [Thermoanaerobaculia bacterium]
MRLVAFFLIFASLGVLGLAAWLVLTPRVVEGRVTLSFKGIGSGEYPSGKKFATEDFREPDVLRAALLDAGISPDRVDLKKLSANLTVAPIIPPEVVARWKRQDRDGLKREDYEPSEFQLRLRLAGIPGDSAVRVFDAIVKRYRDHVKFEQKAALKFVSDWQKGGYRDLIRNYDYWEIPYILVENQGVLTRSLKQLIEESAGYEDASLGMSFRDVQKDLGIWAATRLEALRALTYKGRLVKNKNAALLTAQYQLEDLDIEARALRDQTAQALRLVEMLQKPQPMIASENTGREIPVVDASVMERMMRSDYLSPLVTKISELQEDQRDVEMRKSRMEKDIGYIANAENVPFEGLPQEYRDLVPILSKELSTIIGKYNGLLDRYLTDNVTSLVAIREGPRVTRGVSLPLVVAVILVLSAALALFAILFEHLFRSALRPANMPRERAAGY